MSTIKYSRLLTNTFKNIVLAALIVDDAEQNPIHNLGSDNGIFSKYIDLSATKTGDYNKFLKELGTLPQLEGILLDNVDKIPKNKDREYWEEFVRFALKKNRTSRFPEVRLSVSIKFMLLPAAKTSPITLKVALCNAILSAKIQFSVT
jgi:hypothetical protein